MVGKRQMNSSKLEYIETPEMNTNEIEDEITLQDVVKDSHLQSLFLQYLSTNDKKGFAQMLFLVSVEEFKKLLQTQETSLKINVTPKYLETTHENIKDEKLNQAYSYATKIIMKYMQKDAFLDISNDHLRVHKKSISSFASYLANDLLVCTSLASQVNLFHDVEVVIEQALLNQFQAFQETKAYRTAVEKAHISSWYLVPEVSPKSTRSSTFGNQTPMSGFHSPGNYKHIVQSPKTIREQAHCLTFQRVLWNRRLCSLFWVYLYKQKLHASLSLWMEYRYRLIPLIESFINAVTNPNNNFDEMEEHYNSENQTPEELIEQILSCGSRIHAKHVAFDAIAPVNIVSESDRQLLLEIKRHVILCEEDGRFSLEDAESLQNEIEKVCQVLEYDLKVNQFVRFMDSDSFQSLMASYQSRWGLDAELSGSGASGGYPKQHLSVTEYSSSSESSGSSSTTTLQEILQCMNVPAHQPRRARNKKFTLAELEKKIIARSKASQELISSILRFEMVGSGNSEDESGKVNKTVLFSLTGKLNQSDSRHHHVIPDHVEDFFCPAGAHVVRGKSCPKPQVFHMTIGDTEKSYYGAILTRYVPQKDDSQLRPLELVLRETEGLQIFVPVGLCIISRYPILNTLKHRLEMMYDQMHEDYSFQHEVDWSPSEEMLDFLLSPLESPTSQLSAQVQTTRTPSLPPINFSMDPLFQCLSIEHIVTVLTSLILEKQIALISSRYTVLTSVGETLRSLLFPLRWCHVFAPILPKSMLECLQCPTPFLFGIHSSYKNDMYDLLRREGSSTGIVVVNLDTDDVSLVKKATRKIYKNKGVTQRNNQGTPMNANSAKVPRPHQPPLPAHLRMKLVNNLKQVLRPHVFFSDDIVGTPRASATPTATTTLRKSSSSWTGTTDSMDFPETCVRECFLTVILELLSILEPYRYILSDEFDHVVVFDHETLFQTRPAEDHAFLQNFLETQLFSHEIADATGAI